MINDMCKDEAFKKWCFDTELVINKSWFDLENPSGDEVYIAYEAWRASAQREGYKLAPVDELLRKVQNIRALNTGEYASDEIEENVCEIEAMIGAVE